jgi:hypothetical protein
MKIDSSEFRVLPGEVVGLSSKATMVQALVFATNHQEI